MQENEEEVEKTISKTQPKTIAFRHHPSRGKTDGKVMVGSGGFCLTQRLPFQEDFFMTKCVLRRHLFPK